MMKLLVLSPTNSKTGNHSTVTRISCHLLHAGHQVDTKTIAEGVQTLSQQAESYDVVLSIHAFKSASLLDVIPSHTKLVLVFGGTDLNHDAQHEERFNFMGAVVERADHCVAFSRNMKELACSFWKDISGKITVIHQGVSTHPDENFDLKQYLHTNFELETENVITLIAGIRPVKDPLYLVEAFAGSSLSKSCSFIIIGPLMDEKYGEDFCNTVKGYKSHNVLYIGELSLAQTHAAIAQSLCLVNSSISEGMSGAVLEAFDLGVPVIARCIPGNSYLVEHNETGLLYETPEEFLLMLEKLVTCEQFGKTLAASAKEKLATFYSTDKERQLYAHLVTRVTS